MRLKFSSVRLGAPPVRWPPVPRPWRTAVSPVRRAAADGSSMTSASMASACCAVSRWAGSRWSMPVSTARISRGTTPKSGSSVRSAPSVEMASRRSKGPWPTRAA